MYGHPTETLLRQVPYHESATTHTLLRMLGKDALPLYVYDIGIIHKTYAAQVLYYVAIVAK